MRATEPENDGGRASRASGWCKRVSAARGKVNNEEQLKFSPQGGTFSSLLLSHHQRAGKDFLTIITTNERRRTMRTILAIITAVIMMAAAPAFPHAGDRSRGEVSVEIVTDQGSAFLVIPHKDFWSRGTHVMKKYLEAKKGENYGIIIRNRTPERVGVVIAVDGRNIISGKKSDLRNTEEMYIVGGNEENRYDGWRTSENTVNRFTFTGAVDSYARKTFNDSSAMGVIAVAVYREKSGPQPLSQMKNQKSLPASPSADRAVSGAASESVRDESAGTGFGDEQYSPVVRVAFEPERQPMQKTLVKYEWRDVLCRKGILSCGQERRNRLWDEGEYAPYPPGYRDR
jgi:hypothetical protein